MYRHAGFILVLACGSHAMAQVDWKLIRPSNTGIPGDYCQTIYVDDQDRPWIGGYVTFWEEGGVAYLDTGHWTTISSADYPIIASPRFNDIVKDLDGNLWIGTNQGLLRMDPAAGPDSLVRFDRASTPMPGNQIVGLDVAPDGSIWIADQEFGGSAAGGLVRYEPDTDTWTAWTTASGLPWGGDWPGWDWVDFVATAPDADGGYTVWFGSREMGMATWKDGVFRWFQGDPPPPGEPVPGGLASNDPVDEVGNIWLVTDRGIARRAPDGTYLLVENPFGLTTEISRIYAASGGRAVALTYYADVFVWEGEWIHLGNWGGGTHTYAFAEDSQGDFWVGGIGGAAKYEAGFWQRYRMTNSGMIGFFIDTLALAPNGDAAMNGNAAPGVGGFDIVHPDGTWTNANVATYGLGLEWPYPTDNVSALAYRANGNLLFAPTNNGLKEFDGVGYSELIPNGWPIEHVAVDGLGRAWAATGRGSLFMEDGTGGMTRFTTSDSDLPVGDIAGIVADPLAPGFIWVGAQFGLARTDGTDWTVIPREALGLDQDTLGYHITSFDVTPAGTLWVGSGIGVFDFDPATGEYVRHDVSTSPLPSDDIWNVEIAPDGSTWISTFDHVYPYPGGVSHFDGQTWTTYSQGSSPLPHNQVTGLQSRPVAGGYELWIATASEAVAVATVLRPIPGDLDGDGDVDLADLATLLAAFGTCDGDAGYNPTADIDASGCVDLGDLATLLANFES